jgi:predicted PurR-regulated permease PerM
VAATIILVLALGAVSEIVLPLTFAAVLAMIFKPAVGMGHLIMQTQMHRRTT